MSEKKPIPTAASAKGKLCPVCSKPSYSRDGVHPQCSVVQADEPRKQQLAADKKRKEELAKNQRLNNS